MADFRACVLSLTAAAMLCSILRTLPVGKNHGLIRLVLGLFLTLAALRPFSDISFSLPEVPSPDALSQEASGQGEKMARKALGDIIKQRTEAYILEKAQQLGASIQVEVALSEEAFPVPVGASIRGSLTADVHRQLKDYLNSQLGIPEENLQWNGDP